MQWKKLGKHFLIGLAICLLGFICCKAKAERESKLPQTNQGEKYFPNNPKFGVIITIKTKVAGSPSLGAVFTTKKNGSFYSPCPTTKGRANETGCTFEHKLNMHSGDQVTVEVYRSFAIASEPKRQMMYHTYTVTNGPEQIPLRFIDPNGFGENAVRIQTTNAFKEKNGS